MLSDITTTSSAQNKFPIDKVGMENVEIPVKIGDILTPATHDIFVNLTDPSARGIHMSRIFLITKDFFEKHSLSFETLSKITKAFIDSQDKKSTDAQITSHFTHIQKSPSLVSPNIGWRHYKSAMKALRKKSQEFFELSIQITYSSTCPCSAGLSRQKSQEKFAEQFPNETLSKEEVLEWLETPEAHPATPHSQRSIAFVKLSFDDLKKIPEISDVIALCENTLKTPVQSVVKREDEQRFAELNGQNLLFSEDAVRRIAVALNQKNIRNFSVTVEHQESLHPHNAVATIEQNPLL